MPFKSEAQRRYLWSQKPEVARKFAKDEKMLGATPSFNVGDRCQISMNGNWIPGEVVDSKHHVFMNETIYRVKPDHRPRALWVPPARLKKV